ncbi:MAG: BatD family protein [Psychroflexus salarius]
MLKKISFIFSLFCVTFMTAQVTFVAKASREKVGINERIKVEFEVNKDGDNFIAPDFEGFKRIAGPGQSVKQQWVNGESSFSKTYTYFIQPMKRGQLTIGQAEIEVQGQVYKTSPITIEVTAAVDNPDDGNGNRIDLSDAIHLVAEVSDYKPYVNEGISVVYKLYVNQTTNVRNWRSLDEPKYNNFWSQIIEIDQPEVKQGTYGGSNYRYVELRKTVLYPQKNGKLTIEPLSLSVSVEVPSNRRDFFGRRLYDVVERTISAKAKTVDVKALPEANKPTGFSGAVGKFSLNTSLSKTELMASESLNYEVRVSGNGNLRLFSLPKPKFPSSVDVYDPEHDEKVSTRLSGLRGQITDNYTIVPNVAGSLEINPVQFSYFDPSEETYKTLTSKAQVIKVNPNPNLASANNTSTTSTGNSVASTGAKNIISTTNTFNFIELETEFSAINSNRFYNSFWFWLLIILSLGGIPLAILIKKFIRSKSGIRNTDHKRANKLAKRYLSGAKQSIGTSEAFYMNLELALHKFLKAKLRIETQELTKEGLRDKLSVKQVNESEIEAVIKLIEKCELARYASAANQDMQTDYKQATELISNIDKQL